MGLALVGYIEAIERAPLALVGIVYMSYPVFTLLFAWLLVHQRPNWRAWSAVGCVLAAAALALAPGAVGNAEAMALAWALPAPIAFGFIVVVLSACVHRLTLFERLSCAMLGSSLGLAPVALAPGSGPLLPDFANTWMLVAGMGFFYCADTTNCFTPTQHPWSDRPAPPRPAASSS